MPHGDVHETLEVNAHFAPVKMCTRLDRLSPVIAYGCARRGAAADAARGRIVVEGSDPPSRGLGTGAGPCVFSHAAPALQGSLPSKCP